jgi:hypothetical protein
MLSSYIKIQKSLEESYHVAIENRETHVNIPKIIYLGTNANNPEIVYNIERDKQKNCINVYALFIF